MPGAQDRGSGFAPAGSRSVENIRAQQEPNIDACGASSWVIVRLF